MALIGNPMDFDRIRQKYESIVYPSGRRNNFDQVRDSYAGLLGNQGQVDPLTGQPINMSALTSGGFNTISQDATQAGQQVQFRINPQTGATEAVIPEYMGGFRSDQQDFLPGTGGFENIYDAGLGQIDPNTGQVRSDPGMGMDPGSGAGSVLAASRPGDGGMGGYYGFQNRDGVGVNPVTHEVINGVAYRINKATGEVDVLDGIDETIAKALNTYVSTPFSIPGLLNTITGGVNKTYHEKMKDLKEINEKAYNDVTLNVKEQYISQQYEEKEEPFNVVDEVVGFFSGLFAGDDDGKKGDGPKDPGPSVSGAGTDGTGGPDSQYGGDGPASGPDTSGPSNDGVGGGPGPRGGTGSPGDGNAPGPGGCFVEGTAIQMADGTTKEITTIKVGEETKGGIVQAKMEFMPQNIYNYKDVLVSGSHWVVEDNQLIAVEDSKHGVLTDRIEPVYTFKTSNNRIWINDIEFGDFETGSDADWEPHFEMVRQKLNKELRDGK